MKECEEIRHWYNEFREPNENLRIEYDKQQIERLGYDVTVNIDNRSLSFQFKGNTITVFPYKGWFSGKGIKQGRGINNLLKQIKK